MATPTVAQVTAVPRGTEPQRATVQVVTPMTGKSRTKQAFKDAADINNIMARYKATGEISYVNGRTAVYGDFTGHEDLLTALTGVQDAHARFEELPAKIRDRFGNDPVQLLGFVDQAENRAEAIELGLIEDPEGSVRPAAPAAQTDPEPTPDLE